MIRAFLVGAVTVSIAVGLAAPAASDPDPVPGMQHGVVESEPCANWERFTYGWSPDGDFMACVSFDSGKTGLWSKAVPVVGVREPGTSCDVSQGYFAQAPDGRPLQCSNSIWYPPPNGNWG
jgi:hypothetical protein